MADFESLRLFADVVRCRSFSRAADLHGVSQSAASQRVSHLEKSLGVRLLDRSVRPPALTEAGRVFFEGCTDMLGRYDRLAEQVGALRDGGGQAVRVAAIYSAGIEWLSRVRAAFVARETGVEVEVVYDSPDAVYRAVTEGEAGLGLVSFAGFFEGVSHRPVRDEPMAVVCPPGHALSREPAVSAKHLGGFDMLAFDPRLPVGRAVAEYLGRHGVTPRVTHSFDNLDTLKSAVVGTGGFAILPRRTVAAEVQQGRLAAVALRPALLRPMALIFPPTGKRGGELPPAVERFAAFVLEHADPDAFASTPVGSPVNAPAVPRVA